jgi:hypothetical protein
MLQYGFDKTLIMNKRILALPSFLTVFFLPQPLRAGKMKEADQRHQVMLF